MSDNTTREVVALAIMKSRHKDEAAMGLPRPPGDAQAKPLPMDYRTADLVLADLKANGLEIARKFGR